MSTTIGAPQQSGLDVILQQLGAGLGQGAQQGIQNQLAAFQEQKKKAAQADQLEKLGLPREFAGMDPVIIKEILKRQSQQNVFQSIQKLRGGQPELREEGQPEIASPAQGISEDDILAISSIDPNAARLLQQQQKLKSQESLQEKKLTEQKIQTGLKDTSKLRSEFASESKAATKSIQSKEQLLKLIEKGNLTHPLIAGVANFLPKGFRESLLSSDALQYEAGLFDEFGVLKGMFPGQIRTAELNILEPKLASLFKNNEAKKQILGAGIDAAQASIIRGRVAAQVEREAPELTLGAFEEEVEKRAAPKLQKLWDTIDAKLNAIADKYSDIVTVYDDQGKAVGTVNKKQANQLPSGYSIQ